MISGSGFTLEGAALKRALEGHTLYMFWSEDTPLYVGVTSGKGLVRVFEASKRTTGRAIAVAAADKLECIFFASGADARTAECAFIQKLKPKYNKKAFDPSKYKGLCLPRLLAYIDNIFEYVTSHKDDVVSLQVIRDRVNADESRRRHGIGGYEISNLYEAGLSAKDIANVLGIKIGRVYYHLSLIRM